MRLLSLVLLSFSIVTACTNTNEYHQVFRGESETWRAELIQDASVSYKDHEELEDRSQVDYEIEEKLTITYKGEPSELTDIEVEFVFDSRNGRKTTRTIPYRVENEKIFLESHSSSSSSFDYPKGRKYPAVSPKEKTIEVIIKWAGKEEIVSLEFF